MRVIYAVAAAVLLTLVAEHLLDLGVIAALVVAAASLIALLRPSRRDPMYTALLIVMPFAGWLHADPQWRRMTVTLYLVLAGCTLVAAIVKRRGVFVTAAISIVLATVLVLWSTGNPPAAKSPPETTSRPPQTVSRKNVPRATFCVQSPRHHYL